MPSSALSELHSLQELILHYKSETSQFRNTYDRAENLIDEFEALFEELEEVRAYNIRQALNPAAIWEDDLKRDLNVFEERYAQLRVEYSAMVGEDQEE
jgi:hypothetical protein